MASEKEVRKTENDKRWEKQVTIEGSDIIPSEAYLP
jgi:hypothetical protein